MDSRLFIGIKIPGALADGLVKIQQELKLVELKAKFVEAENLHINLKFLGATPQEEIEKISFAIQNTAANFQKFNIEVNGVGTFPEVGNPRVIWAGVSSDELFQLHNLLEQNLSEIGLPKETKKFTPHITLARIKELNNQKLKHSLQTYNNLFGTFQAEEISLIQSELSEKGPKYFDLRKYRLGD